VAYAAIHISRIPLASMDTGLGPGILRRPTIGAPNRYIRVGVRQYDEVDIS
jgi:hypothetical protein